MKRLVPSTPGELSVIVTRKVGTITTPKRFAKYMMVREVVNTLIADHDTPDNPIVAICVRFNIRGAA